MNVTTRMNLLDAGLRYAWAAVLLTLPVTSFRYFPGDDGTYVRPLALYPLAVLALILFIQLARRKITFPAAGALTPLLAFLLAAAAAGVLGILLAPVPVRGQEALGRIARAWATILIGVAFFGASVWMNRKEADLRFTLKWLLAGLVLDILWSGVQGATFYLHVLPKPLVTHWQRAFSMRELIRTNRVSGLAYEPSWLAGQLATVYLPWLFAAVLTGYRLSRSKWLEPALLVLAIILLLATYSRGGLLTVAVAAALTLLFVGREQIRAAAAWLFTGYRRGRTLLLKVGALALIVLAIAGGLLFLGQKGYIARLWNTQASSLEDFLIANSAGARAAYTWSALAAYGEHPWIGVGPGASGLYMYSNLPDWALTTVPEIARQLSPDSALYPNPKNLYVRLLAETGLIGFFLFLGFQFFLLGDALAALHQASSIWRFVAVAGIFTWFALIVYNMTQDSLAIPNLWINLGMLAGMSTAVAQTSRVRVPAEDL
jgi:O-antigen ligase